VLFALKVVAAGVIGSGLSNGNDEAYSPASL